MFIASSEQYKQKHTNLKHFMQCQQHAYYKNVLCLQHKTATLHAQNSEEKHSKHRLYKQNDISHFACK